ncbi:hypothetical protein [Albidovulum sp.]|uniref:hypothetical protein n=1 Tax=Albidovulum sp. TaxID=1872424 RepID=UPI0039B8C837
MIDDQGPSSAGHKLGQLVGDWFQDSFVTPLLREVADRLGLFLDHRTCERSADVRGGKILWADGDENHVDYDFVMELAGSPEKRGIPVAFLECFWRRGARHSKDKARDDSGKLVPMRSTYPTARFLGIVASGEFTRPARELIDSRKINLLYVPKAKVIETFRNLGLEMDYDDRADEGTKLDIASRFGRELTAEVKKAAADSLRAILGETAVRSYVASVQAALSSPPLEFELVGHRLSRPMIFETVDALSDFLSASHPAFDFDDPGTRFSYRVNYSDGAEFEREVETMEELLKLHEQIAALAAHMADVLSGERGL